MDNSEDNRKTWREMLSRALKQVIPADEQSRPFAELLKKLDR